jgi:hypothetical protein
MLLTIELVPKTAWFKNLRNHVGATKWYKIKKEVYARAGHRCEICNGVGKKWPVEAHEVWKFENNKIILERMIALCPSCHEVKHIGLAAVKGRLEIAKKHLMKINNLDNDTADLYIMKVFELFERRSTENWELDLSSLEQYLK